MALGEGIFETMRAVDGTIRHWSSHRERLLRSHRALSGGLWRPDLDTLPLLRWVTEHLETRQLMHGEARVRLALHAGPAEGAGEVIVDARAMAPSIQRRRTGINPWIVPWRPPITAAWKTTSYLPYLWAARLADAQAREAGVAEPVEPLLVDAHTAEVLEGATWNIFVVEGRTLRTPPLDGRILPGTSRHQLIERARARGWTVVEAAVTTEMLSNSDGVLATNALLPVAPLACLNGHTPLAHPTTALAELGLW